MEVLARQAILLSRRILRPMRRTETACPGTTVCRTVMLVILAAAIIGEAKWLNPSTTIQSFRSIGSCANAEEPNLVLPPLAEFLAAESNWKGIAFSEPLVIRKDDKYLRIPVFKGKKPSFYSSGEMYHRTGISFGKIEYGRVFHVTFEHILPRSETPHLIGKYANDYRELDGVLIMAKEKVASWQDGNKTVVLASDAKVVKQTDRCMIGLAGARREVIDKRFIDVAVLTGVFELCDYAVPFVMTIDSAVGERPNPGPALAWAEEFLKLNSDCPSQFSDAEIAAATQVVGREATRRELEIADPANFFISSSVDPSLHFKQKRVSFQGITYDIPIPEGFTIDTDDNELFLKLAFKNPAADLLVCILVDQEYLWKLLAGSANKDEKKSDFIGVEKKYIAKGEKKSSLQGHVDQLAQEGAEVIGVEVIEDTVLFQNTADSVATFSSAIVHAALTKEGIGRRDKKIPFHVMDASVEACGRVLNMNLLTWSDTPDEAKRLFASWLNRFLELNRDKAAGQ